MAQLPLTPHRWTRAGYERLVELGAFRGEAVELLGGQLIVAEPQSSYHATAVGTVDDARAALPPGWIVRAQMPIGLADDSAPEPNGWSYGAVELLRPPATATPLAFPASWISVADLLA